MRACQVRAIPQDVLLFFEKHAHSTALLSRKSDFKHINQATFYHFPGGRSALNQFRGFLNFLEHSYPFLPFNYWDFHSVNRNYWNCSIRKEGFMELLVRNFPEVKQSEDWKRIQYSLLESYSAQYLCNTHPKGYHHAIYRDPTAINTDTKGINTDINGINGDPTAINRDMKGFGKDGVNGENGDMNGFGRDALDRQKGGVGEQYKGECDGDELIVVLLEEIWPQFFWEQLRRYPRVSSVERKRMFMDRFILKHFNFVKTEADVAHIQVNSMRNHPGGCTVVKLNNGNRKTLFSSFYPQLHPIYPKVTKGYWKRKTSQDLVKKVMKSFSLKMKEDWYRLSSVQLSKIYGKLVSKRILFDMLLSQHPEEEWEKQKFSNAQKSNQRFLGLKLGELFPGEVILEEYLLRSKERNFMVDFFIPGKQLMVEYQGEQHYYNVVNWLSLEEQRKRDTDKRRICEQKGFLLVDIPFWWNGTLSELSQLLTTPNISPLNKS